MKVSFDHLRPQLIHRRHFCRFRRLGGLKYTASFSVPLGFLCFTGMRSSQAPCVGRTPIQVSCSVNAGAKLLL